MLAKVKSYALDGIRGYPVVIEIDTVPAVPSFDVVGLPSNSIKEAKNRIRSAIINTCFNFVHVRATINLAPADIKKDGSQFDFPMALGFLISTSQVEVRNIEDYIILGELSLDGKLRAVSGIMPIILSSYQDGHRKFLLPKDNAKEASYIDGIEVYPITDLSEACAFLGGFQRIDPFPFTSYKSKQAVDKYGVDLKEVMGQKVAKRALEIAVAGGHNMLMNGPPGAGKTMLAKCVPTIMPKMTFDEALEVTKIHSVAGILDIEEGIVTTRPFRTPHHTASQFSLIGGGTKSLPGEVSLAHNGVLFLDEMPEYPRKTLETLRQPLEDHVITVTRVARSVEYPARFMLIASMNPCPCGNLGSKNNTCTCNIREIKAYHARISGPLLDRIDINVEVDSLEYRELRTTEETEDSKTVRERVEKARNVQLNRYKTDGIYTNAELNNRMLKIYCQIDAKSEAMLEKAFIKFKLSARATSRILKISRTIADLAGEKDINIQHLAEAIQYRAQEKRYD